MNNKRSLEAQRARLMNKKSSSKPVSDKFVKKEIINMKYGIQKPVKASKPLPSIAIFFIAFFAILIVSIFIIHPVASIALAVVIAFLIARFMPKKPIIIKINKDYHLQQVIIEYEPIMSESVKTIILSINGLMKKLSSENLNPKEAYYIESNIERDIPSLFLNLKEIPDDKEAQEKIIQSLILIENKLKDIYCLYSIDYRRNLEIKKRVIEEKALD